MELHKNAPKEEGKKPQENHGSGREAAHGGKDADLNLKLAEERARSEELKEVLQRVQAEFENYIKRSERDNKTLQEMSNVKLLQEFLPVLDSFDAATGKNGKGNSDDGVALLRKQLWGILERHGIREMKSLGEKFDPEMHECLMFENAGDKEDDVVIEEIQKGYMMKDRVIRHAKVKVG